MMEATIYIIYTTVKTVNRILDYFLVYFHAFLENCHYYCYYQVPSSDTFDVCVDGQCTKCKCIYTDSVFLIMLGKGYYIALKLVQFSLY